MENIYYKRLKRWESMDMEVEEERCFQLPEDSGIWKHRIQFSHSKSQPIY